MVRINLWPPRPRLALSRWGSFTLRVVPRVPDRRPNGVRPSPLKLPTGCFPTAPYTGVLCPTVSDPIREDSLGTS